MRSPFTRRDILFAATGSAVGLALSPAPWKLLGDSAIWTQRSRLSPEALRGDVTSRFSACTLCPAGCALKARCVGTPAVPVSMSGVKENPVSHGALCSTGFAVHHLARHPLRLTGPARISPRTGGVEAASTKSGDVIAAVAEAVRSARGAAAPLAVLDLRPGRMASLECRRILAGIPGAIHVVPASRDASTLEAIRAQLEGGTGPLGVDLLKPRTILGFGAPLREGWGTPGSVPVLVTRQNEGSLRLVQIEARRSPTAEGADLWIPVRPGTEAAVALGLAHLLVAEGLVAPEVARRARDLDALRAFVAPFEPGAVERVSGFPNATLRSLAQDIAEASTLAIGSGAPGSRPLGIEEERAIAILNLLLGNPGLQSGLVVRRELPAPAPDVPLAREVPLSDLADGSIGVLVVDGCAETVPWDFVASKLAKGSTVVSLSPWLAGPALHATWAVPAPGPLEFLDEVLTPAGAPAASWALAPALVAPPAKAVAPSAFYRGLAAALGSSETPSEGPEALLGRRAAAIVAAGRGRVFTPGTGSTMPVAEAGGPDGLFAKLSAGGAWIDDPVPPAASLPRFTLLPATPEAIAGLAAVAARGRSETPAGTGVSLDPEGWVGSNGTFPEPAILGKLGRESLLRASAATRRTTPVTIREA